MSRFAITTLLALLAFFAIGLSLHGTTRLWAFCGFWTVYLTIVGCGVGLIQLQFFGRVICRGNSNGMQVALTFDDGPDPLSTSAILDLLKQEGISAAFFCIGKNVSAHPELAARIVAEGHLIANHTFHHGWWTAFLGRGALKREIELGQKAIVEAVGAAPMYMRPPVGLTNPNYSRVLKQLGLTLVGWDVRSLDTFYGIKKTVARVTRQTRAGSIILLHDGGSSPEKITEIVSKIIADLRGRGFELVRLDQLIAGG